MTLTIVSGPPGAGKTALAAALAARHARGVHLATDDFYRFLAHPIDPSTTASKTQNETVVSAFLAAANAFAAGGYDVFIDGVIGPWWLPTLRRALGEFRYVLLMVDLERALQRTTSRPTQPSARPAVVAEMHRQFARDLDAAAGCVLDTTGLSPEAVLNAYLRRAASGFRPPA